jgi:hypothetical protein
MMRTFKKVGVAAVAAVSLVGATVAASSSAEARHINRGWRSGYFPGTVVVGGLALSAVAATRPYGYRYGHRYWDYAPGGPFVDYPYQNCGFGPRLVAYTAFGNAIVSTDRVCWY